MTKTIKLDYNTVEVDGVVYKREERKNGVWVPEMNEKYFCVKIYGSQVLIGDHFWANDEVDGFNLDMGNAFRTEEEAKKHLERLKAQARVNREIREKEYRVDILDWKAAAQRKYYIWCAHADQSLGYGYYCHVHAVEMFYGLKDKESCEALIKSHGDDIKLAMGITVR